MIATLKKQIYGARKTIKSSANGVEIQKDIIDRYLDIFVKIGGSGWTFLVVIILLIGWIIGLIPTKASVTWQSAISDVQAIVCYIYDSLLMRQQLGENEMLLATSGLLRSRMTSIHRMVKLLKGNALQPVENMKVDFSKLRQLTGYTVANDIIIIEPPSTGKIEKIIDIYAEVVGRLVGIIIIFIVLAAWIAVGPLMHFNSNWFLISGTYAGLIGLFDGFVLRNAYARSSQYEEVNFDILKRVDELVLMELGLPIPEEPRHKYNFSGRVAVYISSFFASPWIVVFGLIIILGMVVGASASKWSVTGQLICNVPPSLVESFFMMVLITAHSIADQSRRNEACNIFLRRELVLKYVNSQTQVVKDVGIDIEVKEVGIKEETKEASSICVLTKNEVLFE